MNRQSFVVNATAKLWKAPTFAAVAGTLLALAASFAACGCGSSSVQPPPPPAIEVSVSQATANLQPQASAQFSASVSNDPSGKGVTWSITSCNGKYCGTISPSATASGAPMTYTAPPAPVVALMITVTAAAVADTTKTASVAITVPAPTTVSVSPGSATVLAGGTQAFTATVGNDPENGGVTWQVLAKLFCNGIFSGRCYPRGEPSIIYLPCSGCGTFSGTVTKSGAPVTYAAANHLTPPVKAGYFFCGFCSGNALVVATSVTYTASSASAPLSLPQISLSMSPGSAIVALTGAQQFTATVKNDGTNSGVNWTVTQNGIICSPACGTMSSARTASGVASTYTAPANAPVSPLVRVTANSVEDSTKSVGVTFPLTTSTGAAACAAGSGNESLLKGQYAFLFNGGVGSFTADGTGKVTAGEADMSGPGNFAFDSTMSSYAVGSDQRGCLVLNGTNAFFLSLGSINSRGIATAGHIVAIPGYVSGPLQNALPTQSGAGNIRLQNPASFAASQFSGDYALGFTGIDLQPCCARAAMAGTFTVDGASAVSSAEFDVNDRGTITNLSSAPAGTFTCCDSNGRGGLSLTMGNATGIAFYVINSSDAFLADLNNVDVFEGVGEAKAVPSGTTFTQTSLNGISVLRTTTQSPAGPVVDIATVGADGINAMTTNDNVNKAGAFTSSSTAFNYTVTSDGRVTVTGGSTPPVLYLSGQNQGFLLGTDPDGTFGILEPQAPGPFSNASFAGAYTLGTENPSVGAVTMQSGVLNADGHGNAVGTVDEAIPAALPLTQSLSFSYTFPANGVGKVGSGTTAIMISGNKLVFINNNSANPTVTVVEK